VSDFNKFMNHLDQSHDAVWQVARWFVKHGSIVQVNTTSKAKSHKEWRDHIDSGDLYLSQRVEVKGLGAEFTSAEDWPFKDQFMVCAKHSYDIANPKPYMYVYLNKARTHLAVLKADTYNDWFIKTYKDKRYENLTQDFYVCPTKLLKFMEIK